MFFENRFLMTNAYVLLQHLPVDSALRGSLVLEGLLSLIECASEFDKNLLGEPFFRKHFFAELASLPQRDGSHWFSLFEYLALIFREQALMDPYVPLPRCAQRIQDYFEMSGEWEPDDGTLVSHWYWVALPDRHDFSAT